MEAASDPGSDCEVSGDYCYTKKEHFISGSLSVGNKYLYIYLLTLPHVLWQYQLTCKSLAFLKTDFSEQGADPASLFSDKLQVIWNK